MRRVSSAQSSPTAFRTSCATPAKASGATPSAGCGACSRGRRGRVAGTSRRRTPAGVPGISAAMMPTALPWSGSETRSAKMRYRCVSSLNRWMSRWNLKAAAARAVEGVAGGHRVVQGVEGFIEATMVLLVGLGDRRRDLLYGGENGDLLPVGVQHQHLVEEAEALQRRLVARLPRAAPSAAASMPSMSLRNALCMAVIASIGPAMIVTPPSALLPRRHAGVWGVRTPLGAMKRRCTPRFAYRTRSSSQK